MTKTRADLTPRQRAWALTTHAPPRRDRMGWVWLLLAGLVLLGGWVAP